MRIKSLLALTLVPALALALPASSSEAQRRGVARAQDWTRVAARTPEGGFRMGNPGAPVKVVEYLSLTCPHCAMRAAPACSVTCAPAGSASNIATIS